MNSSEQQKISVHPDYVLVERDPNYKVVLSKEHENMARIAAFCKESGCNRLLIIGSNTKVRLSATDIFELGSEIARIGLKVAVVETHDAKSEDVEFLETVSQNRGGPIQFFHDRKDAEDWLRDG